MVGKKILIIRMGVTITIIIATFAVGWYLFSRFFRLDERFEYTRNQEVNNPRLNYSKLDTILNELEQREENSLDLDSYNESYEENPFYNPSIIIEEDEDE